MAKKTLEGVEGQEPAADKWQTRKPSGKPDDLSACSVADAGAPEEDVSVQDLPGNGAQDKHVHRWKDDGGAVIFD